MQDPNRQSLEEALSLERFSRYLTWAGGDRDQAIFLYTLNTQLSESLYTPLQMLEIALRNRIHTVMSSAEHPNWFDDPRFQKGSRQHEQLEKAKEDLTEQKKPIEPGRVVAALTFSYWTTMLGAPYEDLWQHTLRRIAQREDGKGLRRKDLSGPLTPIRILRNRIAHHEPILGWDLPKHYRAMMTITGWLSPAAAAWCQEHCRFPRVYPAEPLRLSATASKS